MKYLSPIIEVDALVQLLQQEGILIFDVSNGPDAQTNFVKEHIYNAQFIDLNTELADIKDDLSLGGRHPLPDIKFFAEKLSEKGVSNESHIILYDDKNGSNAAARFWWMLKSIGHRKVQVLNGGLQLARKRNVPMESGVSKNVNVAQKYIFSDWKLPTKDINEVEKMVQDKNFIVVDVRDKNRFDGKSEPIDLIAGHIPGAINFPFTENLDSEGLFLSPDRLKEKYLHIFGNIPSNNIVVHCGSGVTACHTLLSLDYAGLSIPNLYVGSWSEWSRKNKPIATSSE